MCHKRDFWKGRLYPWTKEKGDGYIIWVAGDNWLEIQWLYHRKMFKALTIGANWKVIRCETAETIEKFFP